MPFRAISMTRLARAGVLVFATLTAGCGADSAGSASTIDADVVETTAVETVAVDPVDPVPLGVYVVAVDGDDAAPGTAERPWRTIQHAVDSVGPGDTVQVRDGIYSESLVVTTSGTEEAGSVTLVNAPGARPVIDGTDLPVPEGLAGLVTLSDVSWFRLEGFEIRNWRAGVADRVPVGINIEGASSNVEIVGNEIHRIEADNSTGDRNAHGIAVYGRRGDASISNLTIADNELHDLVLGTSEALVLNGNVERFTITGNVVRDVDNIGIDVIGYEGTSSDPATDRARDGVIAGNLVYGVDTARNDEYASRNAAGIYIDGGLRVTIDGNVVRDSNIGIEIASEASDGATSDIIVRNNLLYRNHLGGLAMGGYDTERGRTERCRVEFNTFVGNDTDGTGNGELWLQYDLVDNSITDNVIVAGGRGVLMSNPYAENLRSVVDRNLWFTTSSTPTWQWREETSTSFDEYRAATGNDAESLFADPRFAGPDDFALAAGAPGIGVGRDGADLGASPRDEVLLLDEEAD